MFYMETNRLVGFFLTFVICTGCFQMADTSSIIPAENMPGERGLLRPGIFYGRSNGIDGERVWILRIDEKTGFLKSISRNLAINAIYEAADGTVKFQTNADIQGFSYAFRGRPDSQNFLTDIMLTNHDDKDRVRETLKDVKLERIDNVLGTSTIPLGHFSSLRINEESGDINGAEIVLLQLRGQLVGSFYVHEIGLIDRPFVGKIEDGKIIAVVNLLNGSFKMNMVPTKQGSLKLITFMDDGNTLYDSQELKRIAEITSFLRNP